MTLRCRKYCRLNARIFSAKKDCHDQHHEIFLYAMTVKSECQTQCMFSHHPGDKIIFMAGNTLLVGKLWRRIGSNFKTLKVDKHVYYKMNSSLDVTDIF